MYNIRNENVLMINNTKKYHYIAPKGNKRLTDTINMFESV